MSNKQLPFRFEVSADYGRDRFIVSASNREALSVIDRWPNWPNNILALIGPTGSGKTHLGSIWTRVAHATSLSPKNLDHALLSRHPDGGAFLLEDANQYQSEEDFFHLINETRRKRHTLLITAPTEPARWRVSLPDLKSRLAAINVARLEFPDDMLIESVLEKLFEDRQLAATPEVLNYLMRRMDRTLHNAAELVSTLDAAALAKRTPITIAVARAALEAQKPD
jgi:chromosomal replication initiation ATPase DnaA